MDIKEALEAIAETNEPLALVLQHILDEQDQIEHSQRKVIEALVTYLATSTPGKMDLSFLGEILKNQ